MAILGVNDFKSKLKGGGARPNLFQVILSFPAYVAGDVELASFMIKAAQMPASVMGTIPVAYRGRQLQMAGDRTFEPWAVTVINDTDFKPINIIKQKVDQVINGENVFKTRDSIETQIYPVAKIIKDFNAGDTEIFLDNADLFKYDAPNSFSMMVVAGIGSTEATGNVEFVGSANTYMGFSGIVTGITTTTGIGVPLALEMEIISNDFTGLNVGYPIYISDTNIGTGVTSINDSDAAVVGIGSTFLDNVYYIHGLQTSGTVGIITCNIHSASNVVGLGTTMNIHNPVGKYSWGRVADFTRSSNPISIGVSGFTIPSASVGISTFPIAQRRGVGLRDNGSLPKQL